MLHQLCATPGMKSFTFVLRYQCLEPHLGNHPDMPGILSLEYERSAMTARQAVMATVAELRELIPRGYLLGVGPDFVDLKGVARLLKLNTKNARHLIARYGALFPAPQFIGAELMWHCADILGLIAAQALGDVSETEIEMAQFARVLNRTLRDHAR
jgi:hypothetical protein